MKKIEKLDVMFRGQKVGTLSLTPDNRLNVFAYDKSWIDNGFSISPLELPLKPGVLIAKPKPFYGNFGIFEDSLPDGYGRYLLHKALLRKGINDSDLSSLDRLAIVGNNGMGALSYSPAIKLSEEKTEKKGLKKAVSQSYTTGLNGAVHICEKLCSRRQSARANMSSLNEGLSSLRPIPLISTEHYSHNTLSSLNLPKRRTQRKIVKARQRRIIVRPLLLN